MSTINKIPQRQVKSIREEFTSLEAQLTHVESRTRNKVFLNYNTKTQWDIGPTQTNIDTETVLDTIRLTNTGGVYDSEGTYISYVIDTGAVNVAADSISYTHTKPANTSIQYFTRSGNTAVPDDTWSAWTALPVSNLVQSANARYFQFKIVLSTTNTAYTPSVSGVSFYIWGGIGLQEVFDARGGYPTLADRLDNISSIFHLKVLPSEGQTEIPLGRTITDGIVLKVYVNGMLQSQGSYPEDQYTIETGNTVVFADAFDGTELVICRIEGTGSGAITVKEARIVNEMPSTPDHIVFSLNRTPVPGKEEVYVGGIKMLEGADNDYTLAGNVITFNYATPQPDVDEEYHPRVTYIYTDSGA
jgi:hypothetical protein